MNKKEKNKQKSPMDFFFSIGDKVTKGDPKKKADFDYYMLWVMFFAFLTVFASDIYLFIISVDSSSIGNFFSNSEFSKLGWGVVVFAVLWFQYNNLKMVREGRKAMQMIPPSPKEEIIESAEDMINGFNALQESSEISSESETNKGVSSPLNKSSKNVRNRTLKDKAERA